MLSTKFDYTKLDHTENKSINLLITAEGAKVDLSKDRKPVGIVAVLDISGSMNGPKLDYAKKSLMKLIDHLSPQDSLATILFDDRIETLFPMTAITAENKQGLKSKISGIHARGSTNLYGAIWEAIKMAKSRDGGNTRVIVFTDGLPNIGEMRKEGFLKLLENERSNNITITGFGYGDDHDAELLGALSEHGRGNYAYVKNPDDALAAFGRELGGLLSCVAQDLRFRIKSRPGFEFKEVLSDIETKDEGPDGVLIKVADLYSEEKRHLVMRLIACKTPKVFPRETSACDITLEYIDTISGVQKTVAHKAKVHFVHRGEEDKSPKQEVCDQVALAQLVKAQIQATEFAKRGNYTQAARAFQNINLGNVHDSVAAYVSHTGDLYNNAHTFTNSGALRTACLASNKSGRSSGQAGVYSSSHAGSAMNSVQQSFVDSFGGSGGAGMTGTSGLAGDGNGSLITTASNTNVAVNDTKKKED